jgi:phosphoglycolate phosphatase-like HAD superfamily hydrolase
MRRRPLLLFDCDGGLLASEDELAARCFDEALSELSGRLWPPDVFVALDPGQTVRGAARELGVDPEAWVQRSLELYFDRFDDGAAVGWQLREDVEPTLRRLALDGYRLALVSPRPEAIVRFRLERLGIGGYFARGTGAFGCEADGREELLRLALWRSACTPRRAVLVTDALRDVSGLPAVAVGSLAELPARLSERHAA